MGSPPSRSSPSRWRRGHQPHLGGTGEYQPEPPGSVTSVGYVALLKGTMSEAELHILRSRMYQGLLNKARRGEVFNHPPTGYIKLPTGPFALDPDEQVQSVIRLL